jgi:predicted metalloprotease with PDZ domain
MNRVILRAALALAFLTCALPAAAAEPNADATSTATQANPMTLELDARPAARGLMYAHLTIPAAPGPFTLVYPKWIPGEHGPTGPLPDLAYLKISAGGRALAWQRDTLDPYAFHLIVPAGANAIEADFDVLLNGPGETMATQNLALVNWNRVLLYQNDTNSSRVFVKPSIILPSGWDYGTGLPGAHRTGDRVAFDEATLEVVVDSPLDLGRYSKHVRLWSEGDATVDFDIFADKPQDLEISDKTLDGYKRMAPEALAAYGARHWQHYHALLTLSDAVGFEGIEHHQSSDNRAPDDFLSNDQEQVDAGSLVTHEFSHSWNGKYRRPDDLTTANFQIPMQTDLLWVYEGMNEYLGDLFAFRSDIRDSAKYPEYFATVYADMDYEAGRLRDPLIDTASGATYLYQARGYYPSLRRTAGDFYAEGELIWIDVDTIIRERTHGQKSFDDFLKAYAGPPDSLPTVKTYTRAQIEQLLADVVPYDWHAFFERSVYQIAVHPPTDEIARAGWKLEYTSAPNEFIATSDMLRKSIDAWYSIGVRLSEKGKVQDVRPESAAWKAGLAPGMTVTAIDGQAFDKDVVPYAIQVARHSSDPIVFLAENNGWFSNYTIVYHDGPKFPHLVRVPGTPNLFGDIMAAHGK